MQVDGMSVQNLTGTFGSANSSYVADTGNAQEISFTLSGALGESETGGTTINVIPRTGGNRYAGNYFTAYRTPTSSTRTIVSIRAASSNV